jgi:hypothetical protein
VVVKDDVKKQPVWMCVEWAVVPRAAEEVVVVVVEIRDPM